MVESAPKSGAAAAQERAPNARARAAALATPAHASERMTNASTREPGSTSPPSASSTACAPKLRGTSGSAAVAAALPSIPATKISLRRPLQSASAPTTIGEKKRAKPLRAPRTPRLCVLKPLDSSQRKMYGAKAANARKRSAKTAEETTM